jgi:Polyketide cyclase / dehydrase and lipid transport
MRVKPFYLSCLILLSGCATMQTRVEINAPAERVRTVLFAFADYPKWNPYIVNVDGDVVEGNRVYLTVRPPGAPEVTGNAKIISVTKDRLAWDGVGMSQVESGPITLAIPGILNAKHEFVIEELAPNRTLFLNNVKWSGAVIPFYDMKPLAAGLEAMNVALKARSEEIAK